MIQFPAPDRQIRTMHRANKIETNARNAVRAVRSKRENKTSRVAAAVGVTIRATQCLQPKKRGNGDHSRSVHIFQCSAVGANVCHSGTLSIFNDYVIWLCEKVFFFFGFVFMRSVLADVCLRYARDGGYAQPLRCMLALADDFDAAS